MTKEQTQPGELASCPFCGYGANIIEGDGKYYVSCKGPECFCALGEVYDRDAMPDHEYNTEEQAKEVWNTRQPDLSRLYECIAAMSDVLHSVADDIYGRNTNTAKEALKDNFYVISEANEHARGKADEVG